MSEQRLSPTIFDAKELRCPEYQIQMRRFITAQSDNSIVLIITAEPAAPRDTRMFCGIQGHDIKEIKESEGLHYILVEVSHS